LSKQKWGVVSAFLISTIFYLLANTIFPFGIQLTRWGYFTLYSSSLIGLPYILYFSLVMVYSFYLLWRCFKSSLNPIKRKQLKIFTLALLVAVTGSNDFLLTFGYQVYPFGYLSIFFFTIITLYAMKYYGFLVLEPAMAYQTIFQSIHNFVVGIDLQGEIGFINNSAQDILGYKEKEIFGKSIETIFPEEDKFTQLKNKIRQGEPSVRGEESYLLTKHKEKIPVLFNFSPILEKGMEKEIFGFVLSAQDITLLKEKEEELVKSEEKYRRTTFENTGTAMAILEEDTTISLVNAQFEKLSGYSKEEIEGKMKWTKLVHPDDLERMWEYNKKRQENPNNAPTQYEFKGIDKKGKIINILINANLIPGSKKTIISLIDPTEKIKLQEQLQEYSQKLEKKVEERTKELLAINEELKKANQVKNDFLANVSHELRTPLTSIRSFSEILLNYKEEDKATQEEFLEIINRDN
jgi:PAS domain S-box-containing protein